MNEPIEATPPAPTATKTLVLAELKKRFAPKSVPLEQDFLGLIELADLGRQAIQAGADTGLNLDPKGRLSVHGGPGITTDADGLRLATGPGLTATKDGVGVHVGRGLTFTDSPSQPTSALKLNLGPGLIEKTSDAKVRLDVNRGKNQGLPDTGPLELLVAPQQGLAIVGTGQSAGLSVRCAPHGFLTIDPTSGALTLDSAQFAALLK